MRAFAIARCLANDRGEILSELGDYFRAGSSGSINRRSHFRPAGSEDSGSLSASDCIFA